MPVTNWAIISAGGISSDFASALKCLPETEHKLVAIAARKKESAEAFAKRLNIPKVYEGYVDIVKDEDIDVFYVGSIISTHFEIVMRLLKAKRNVICEKPLGVNSKEVREIVQTARSMNVFFMEGFWSRFFPVYFQIRNELKDKTIGDARLVKAEFGYPILHKERISDPKIGGSVVLDLGCYLIQFALMVFNNQRPDKVTATGSLYKTGVDSQANFTLSYKDGRMAVLFCTGYHMLKNSACIYGTNGSISIPNLFWCPTQVELPSGRKEFKLPEIKEGVKFNFDNSVGLSYEASAVRKALLDGIKEHPLVKWEDSVLVSEIMDDVRQQIN